MTENIRELPNSGMVRDISMVMPKEILVGQVEEVIEKKGGAFWRAMVCLIFTKEVRLRKALSPLHIVLPFVQRIRHWKRQRLQVL